MFNIQNFILLYFSILSSCSCDNKTFFNITDLYDVLTNENTLPNTNTTNFLIPQSLFDAEHHIGMISCIMKNGIKSCVSNGKVTYFGHFCTNKDFSLSTPFGVGSVSKLFGAATLLRVLEDKPEYFPDDLDTKLEFYLPYLKQIYGNYSFIKKLENRPTFSKMRLKDIMQHTSGIGNYKFSEKDRKNDVKLRTEDEFLSNILNDTEYGEFGYTNIGYNLVSMILRAITGKSYSLLLKKYILVPLNLEETFTILDLENKPDRIGVKKEFGNIDLAQIYSYYKGSLYYSMNFNWDTTSGGLYSTVSDLLTFINNFFRNDGNILFNERTRKLRDTPKVITSTSFDYGIGQFYYRNGWRGHDGSDLGMNAFVAYDFKTNVSVVATITSENLSASLADLILAKGYKKNIPNDRLNPAYLNKRYEIVEIIRRLYSIDQLVNMQRLADINPMLFYFLYSMNYYPSEDQCA